MITVADMATALRDAGIAERQVLLVYSDVAYLGPITGVTGRAEYLAAIWDCLREAAGDHTTIVMSTASTYLCASGADFVLETTPCDTGLLSEHMRTQPSTQRSLHPFVSYSAHGPWAEALTTRIDGVELPRIPVNLRFSPLPLIVAALTTTDGTQATQPSADCRKGIGNHISPTIATE